MVRSVIKNIADIFYFILFLFVFVVLFIPAEREFRWVVVSLGQISKGNAAIANYFKQLSSSLNAQINQFWPAKLKLKIKKKKRKNFANNLQIFARIFSTHIVVIVCCVFNSNEKQSCVIHENFYGIHRSIITRCSHSISCLVRIDFKIKLTSLTFV